MKEFKVGSKVKCIKSPPLGNYQAEVGQVLTIRSIDGGLFYSTEERDIGGHREPCYRIKEQFIKYISKNVIGGDIL